MQNTSNKDRKSNFGSMRMASKGFLLFFHITKAAETIKLMIFVLNSILISNSRIKAIGYA